MKLSVLLSVSFAFISFSLFAGGSSDAAKWDPRQAMDKAQVDTNGVKWIDGRLLPIEGRVFDDTEGYYERLPANLTTNVNGGVRSMKRHTSGMLFRFRTDSKTLVLRWTSLDPDLVSNTLTPVALSGFDVYWRNGTSGWRFLASTCGAKGTGRKGEFIKRLDWMPGNECIINFPLYNGVREFSLGIDENATVSAARPHVIGKPVVFYGTSITQGSAASRPGLAFVNWIGRDLDIPVVGLGFAGSGRMEYELSDHLARIDASCYVLDCLWNMNVPMLEAAYEKFIRNLRAKRPDVPIVMAEQGYVFAKGPKERPLVGVEVGRKHDFVRGLYKRLIAEGWTKLVYLPGDEMHSGDSEGTIDGVHPNDLGMWTMSRAYGKAVRQALGL